MATLAEGREREEAPDFRLRPFPHQLREFEEAKDVEARAMLWCMRSGKTKVVIDTACHLARKGEIDGVLVLAPNGVHRNWVRRELPKHHWLSVPHRAVAWSTTLGSRRDSVYGTTRRMREEARAFQDGFESLLRAPDLAWLAVNVEALMLDRAKQQVARFVRARKRLMLVVDESHDYRTPGSKQSRAARALSRKARYKRILTGTPVANSPLHAYAQFELLAKGALGFDTFEAFKRHYAVYEEARLKSGRSFPRLKEYKNLDELQARIAQWASVITRDDVEGMPALVGQRREVGLTKTQLEAYRQLWKEYSLMDDDRLLLEFIEGGGRLVKLQQVLSGYVVDDQGEVHDLLDGVPSPRLEALSVEVDLCPGQVIVWCQFRREIEMVADRLRRDGRAVTKYHGGMTPAQQDDAIDGFQCGLYDVFVGQPRAGGVGLQLDAADDVVWYSHTPDLIVRQQADERACSIGGRPVGVVDFAVPDSIDEYILDVIQAPKRERADRLAGRGLREVLERIAL